MLTFPNIKAPGVSAALGCSESYKETLQDSTITTTTDANYKKTRPRATRMPGSWTFSWVAMSDADFKILREFFKAVGKSAAFQWTNPMYDTVHVVRLTGEWNWQYNYPVGWQGSLTFEEV